MAKSSARAKAASSDESWSNNNKAHTRTWFTLRMLAQHQEAFDETGQLRMRDLTFWGQAASDDMRKLQTETIAQQLDNAFRMIWRARYEAKSSAEAAISGMLSSLRDGDATVAALGNRVDEHYAFPGETDVV
jgi:hypothetical protein